MQLKRMYLSAAALALGSSLLLSACTNPTTQAGRISYFSEGTITDIEVVDMTKEQYATGKNAGIGAIGGGLAGQLIGRDTKSTLIGAGIGALIGGLGSTWANRSDGMRLTVNTDKGLVLIDEPYSCMYRIGSKVRIINQNNRAQLQVYYNGHYRTAVAQSKSDCPIR